jgi:hypothetical protein
MKRCCERQSCSLAPALAPNLLTLLFCVVQQHEYNKALQSNVDVVRKADEWEASVTGGGAQGQKEDIRRTKPQKREMCKRKSGGRLRVTHVFMGYRLRLCTETLDVKAMMPPGLNSNSTRRLWK